MIFSESAADNRKVLAGGKYQPSVHITVARYHTVSRHSSLIQIKIIDSGLNESIGFHKGSLVK